MRGPVMNPAHDQGCIIGGSKENGLPESRRSSFEVEKVQYGLANKTKEYLGTFVPLFALWDAVKMKREGRRVAGCENWSQKSEKYMDQVHGDLQQRNGGYEQLVPADCITPLSI